MTDWLESFVAHTSYGETPPKIMWWIGVCTIAGALRRKVYIDEDIFQWSPNFYLLIVAKPGIIKKSTSIGLGMRLLKQVEGIDFGPQVVTWQAMMSHMANAKIDVVMPGGEVFPMSCVTIGLSEFGSFFKKDDDDLVIQLTDMWDGKLETVKKETKTSGNDDIVNPWLNIMACCTPDWVAKNFSSSLVGEGFGSRPIYLYADKPQEFVASPRRNMLKRGMPQKKMREQECELVAGLRTFAELAGEFQKTEAAYVWEEKWYPQYMQSLLSKSSYEANIGVRRQTQINKLAMVLSVSRGRFPVIDAQEMLDAERKIKELEEDISEVFGHVGQTPITSAAREIVGVVSSLGPIEKKELYRRYFFRSMGSVDFDAALKSAIASGLVIETGDVRKPVISLRQA